MKKGPWPKQTYDHKVNRYFSLHKVWPGCFLKLCGCGCGQYIRDGKHFDYIFNHHCIGKPAHNKGIPMTEEQKIKLSLSMEGKPAWNKGLKGAYSFNLTEEQVRKRVESRKSKGNPWHSESTKKKNGAKHKGKVISDDVRVKMSKTMKENFLDQNFCQRWVESHSILPNKLELRVQRWLDKLFPKEWKYVGDFQTFIGGKCPDFMNVNGQKKLIEVFGDYWHQNDDPQKRIDHFKEYGFETLVLWEGSINSNPRKAKEAIMDYHSC